MNLCYPIVFLIKAGLVFFLDQVKDHIQANLIIYQWLIRKLKYLVYRTRPDIAFTVGQLSYHKSDSWAKHFRITKQVLRYPKETITLGIVLENDLLSHWQGKYRLLGAVGYTNSNYVEVFKDKQSITGYCFFLKRAITT